MELRGEEMAFVNSNTYSKQINENDCGNIKPSSSFSFPVNVCYLFVLGFRLLQYALFETVDSNARALEIKDNVHGGSTEVFCGSKKENRRIRKLHSIYFQ